MRWMCGPWHWSVSSVASPARHCYRACRARCRGFDGCALSDAHNTVTLILSPSRSSVGHPAGTTSDPFRRPRSSTQHAGSSPAAARDTVGIPIRHETPKRVCRCAKTASGTERPLASCTAVCPPVCYLPICRPTARPTPAPRQSARTNQSYHFSRNSDATTSIA